MSLRFRRVPGSAQRTWLPLAFATAAGAVLASWLLATSPRPAHAGDHPIHVALDAEFGNRTSTADDAIRVGMEIAIEEINRAGGLLGGRPLVLVTRDNRGIPARGVENLRELAGVADLVAVVTSKFSPVVLAQLAPAHELQVPLLAPWSAADPIIDNGRRPNYAFRLSLRDGWVMPRLLNEARRRGFTRVGLLLPNGPWGQSNANAAQHHAASNPVPELVKVTRFEWSDTSLANEYLDLVEGGAEAVLFVGNEPEIALLLANMGEMPRGQWRPILSHWGIAAGDVSGLVNRDLLTQVDLSFVQTFSFIDHPSPKARAVLAAAMQKMKAGSPAEVHSPVGVAHAYDLVHILARAVTRARSTDRPKIRDALEQLPPYDGLIKRYAPPFTADRHEALGPEQIFIARWRRDGAIVRAAP